VEKRMMKMKIRVALYIFTACVFPITYAPDLFSPGTNLWMHQICQLHLVHFANVLSQTRAELPHETNNWHATIDKHQALASPALKSRAGGVTSCPMISTPGLMLRLPFTRVGHKAHPIVLEDRW
jgi:hypothetical protein